jgi:hypothetical protein
MSREPADQECCDYVKGVLTKDGIVGEILKIGALILYFN